ncbi:hypothetical protein [Natronomonas sp. EA1]|uniref:hypothetical protein n=1 Tax=Natronomonas sp. EA1 TaxID=3421655 RepID=UPI003EBD7035
MQRIWWYTLGFVVVGAALILTAAAGALAGLAAVADGASLAAVVDTLVPYFAGVLLLGGLAVICFVGTLARLIQRGVEAFDRDVVREAARRAEERSSTLDRAGILDRL